MSNAAHYRAEALRMLEWARTSPEGEMARRWRQLAEEYATLAEELEARKTGRPPMLRSSMQQQPAQQQQSKTEPKKDE
jgi:hypothetical protein